MELIIGIHSLVKRGGTETYAITVAEQLQRLGHDVTLAAGETGPLAAEVREAGLRVSERDRELPRRPAALLVNDNVSSLRLGARVAGVPQVFVAHSDIYDLQMPPRVQGLVSTVVVMGDRVARHMAAHATEAKVARLRQLTHFVPVGPIRERPRRLLVLSNYLAGARLDLLLSVAREAGLECEVVGRHGSVGMLDDVRDTIADADIVVGKGRAVLEAMACGRAVYVYDWSGADGWVTPERYPLIEADNFAGQAEPEPVSPERLARDLRAYRPEMGVSNRDLAVANHAAIEHAHALVELLRDAAPSHPAPGTPLDELAWLARRMWQAQAEADAQRIESRRALAALDAARAQLAEMTADREALVRQRDEFRSTRRYRLAQALGRPADRLRGRG